ncbi:hypothetical protein [Chryseobacterium sp.]|uniref:hypothetical protein n=1 Tax=Chryseobacterium sp. TaxID=1871047 RepID=UPI0028A2382F|nr:hypothetical protein [Chryseobacterium sp.]
MQHRNENDLIHQNDGRNGNRRHNDDPQKKIFQQKIFSVQALSILINLIFLPDIDGLLKNDDERHEATETL